MGLPGGGLDAELDPGPRTFLSVAGSAPGGDRCPHGAIFTQDFSA